MQEGDFNQYEVQINRIFDGEKRKMCECICPVCGEKFIRNLFVFSKVKSCDQCAYERRFNRPMPTKTRAKKDREFTTDELKEILNPSAIWERMINRNRAERNEELDEIAFGRKESL